VANIIARFRGVCLVPGISRNGRLYERQTIADAVKNAQARIDAGQNPITVLTHHGAEDDSTRIAGRVVKMSVDENGAAHYEAELADTEHSRTLLSLIDTEGGTPFLRNVSIRGMWLGEVTRKVVDGQRVDCAPALELDGLDFTKSPGVPGARIDSVTRVIDSPSESAHRPAVIRESVEDPCVIFTEETPPPLIRSKASLRRAVREASSPAARLHAMTRATALGRTGLIPSHWMEDGSMQETTRYSDVREYYDGPGGAAGFCIDAYNGPTSITIRNCSIDPAELRVIAAAAMDAVVNALQQLDPDMDADVDIDGAPNADTDDAASGETSASRPDDDQMETAPTDGPAVDEAHPGEQPAAPEPAQVQVRIDGRQVLEAIRRTPTLTTTTPPTRAGAAPTEKEEPAVSEPTTETAAPARSLTDADLTALGTLFGTALKETLQPLLAPGPAAEPAKAAETTPAKPDKAAKKSLKESRRAELDAVLKESLAALRAELLPQVRDELRAELLKENGLPPRQGYRVHENEQREPTSGEDLFARRAEILLGDYARVPQPAQ
jgi:hypothetical protein